MHTPSAPDPAACLYLKLFAIHPLPRSYSRGWPNGLKMKFLLLFWLENSVDRSWPSVVVQHEWVKGVNREREIPFDIVVTGSDCLCKRMVQCSHWYTSVSVYWNRWVIYTDKLPPQRARRDGVDVLGHKFRRTILPQLLCRDIQSVGIRTCFHTRFRLSIGVCRGQERRRRRVQTRQLYRRRRGWYYKFE